MKRLNQFFETVDKSQAHLVDTNEGMDDKEFFKLMSKYKETRHDNPAKAAKIMQKIDALDDVSDNAHEAAMYL